MGHLTIRSGQRVAQIVREQQPRIARALEVSRPDTFTPAPGTRAPLSERGSTSPNTPLIVEAYQQVLGRRPDAWGLQHWEGVTAAWRAAGMNDEQIRTRLIEEFMASPEAQALHAGTVPTVSQPAPIEQTIAPTATIPPTQVIAPTQTIPPTQTIAPTLTIPPTQTIAPTQPPATVDTGNYVGGNYTDLGRIDGQEAMPNPLDPAGAQAMRDAAANDLDRLAAQGVDHVRVWAQHPNGLTDPAAIGARIGILAEEAQKRGMKLTVDLFDNYAVGGRNVDNYRALPMDELISNVVGANAGFDDIQWSLGNEIGDPDRPLEFAQWYEDTAAKVRQAGGPGTVISAQLVPGAVNHPWANPVYEEAARRVIAASDVVSVHGYPEGPVGSEPWMSGIEQRSTEWWARATQEAGKKFTIGEFGLPEHLRTPENIDGWLRYYEDELGADHVSLWQFMKDDVGHVDPISWDLVTGNHAHVDDLRNGGWLGRDPH